MNVKITLKYKVYVLRKIWILDLHVTIVRQCTT